MFLLSQICILSSNHTIAFHVAFWLGHRTFISSMRTKHFIILVSKEKDNLIRIFVNFPWNLIPFATANQSPFVSLAKLWLSQSLLYSHISLSFDNGTLAPWLIQSLKEWNGNLVFIWCVKFVFSFSWNAKHIRLTLSFRFDYYHVGSLLDQSTVIERPI